MAGGDVDGTPIPFQGRVQQVAVDEAHGAQPFRLYTQGHAIGRGVHLLYVRFSDDTVMALRKAERLFPIQVQRNPFVREVLAI